MSDTAQIILDALPRAQFSLLRPPTPRFILPGLREGGAGLIVGPGGVGKSFLTLEILRGFASGDGVALRDGECLYTPREMGEPAACGAIFGEDDPEILAMRLHELAAARRADEAEIEFLNSAIDLRSGVGIDLSLLTKNAQGQLVPGPFYSALKLFCAGKKLVVLDPLLFLAGDMDEKDNGAMGALMRLITRLAYETGCAILVIHHVAKAGGEDGRDEAAKARGASSITSSVRLQIDLRAPTPMEMMDMGIDENERGFYVRVAQVKANYTPPRDPRWLYRGRGGVLGAVKMKPAPKAEAEPRGRKGGRNGAI